MAQLPPPPGGQFGPMLPGQRPPMMPGGPQPPLGMMPPSAQGPVSIFFKSYNCVIQYKLIKIIL